jgi:TrmH family RNA methyltransferase
MNIPLRRYKKELPHSYCFGVFPTLELLQHKPENALGVIVHPAGANNTGVEKIKTLCSRLRVPFEFQEKGFSRLGARENDYAIGIFGKFEGRLDAASNHLVLVNPGSMGNLGTIQRTMLGFDFQDLAIIQPAADLFHPEAVRASMGALFQLRIERFERFEQYQGKYARPYYPLMTDGKVELQAVRFTPPCSLVFGNESAGLPQPFHLIGTSVKINQGEKVDSLNIAIAVGITLYEARKKER